MYLHKRSRVYFLSIFLEHRKWQTTLYIHTYSFVVFYWVERRKKMFCFVLRKEFLLLLKRVLKRYVYLHIEKYTTCDLWPTSVPVLFFLENLRIALLKALSFTYSYFGSLASLTSLLGNPCFLQISVWRFLSVLKRNRKALSRGWFLWHINFSFLCHFSLFWYDHVVSLYLYLSVFNIFFPGNFTIHTFFYKNKKMFWCRLKSLKALKILLSLTFWCTIYNFDDF